MYSLNIIKSPGWVQVKTGLMMDWDLESTPLEIKTNSLLGSGDKISLHFKSSVGDPSGLEVRFSSPPKLWISFCSIDAGNFPTSLPTAIDKVWRITLNKNTGIRLQIHCNEVEVLDLLLSEYVCPDSKWREYWGGDIVIVEFTVTDTASDLYRPKPGD